MSLIEQSIEGTLGFKYQSNAADMIVRYESLQTAVKIWHRDPTIHAFMLCSRRYMVFEFSTCKIDFESSTDRLVQRIGDRLKEAMDQAKPAISRASHRECWLPSCRGLDGDDAVNVSYRFAPLLRGMIQLDLDAEESRERLTEKFFLTSLMPCRVHFDETFRSDISGREFYSKRATQEQAQTIATKLHDLLLAEEYYYKTYESNKPIPTKCFQAYSTLRAAVSEVVPDLDRLEDLSWHQDYDSSYKDARGIFFHEDPFISEEARAGANLIWQARHTLTALSSSQNCPPINEEADWVHQRLCESRQEWDEMYDRNKERWRKLGTKERPSQDSANAARPIEPSYQEPGTWTDSM